MVNKFLYARIHRIALKTDLNINEKEKHSDSPGYGLPKGSNCRSLLL